MLTLVLLRNIEPLDVGYPFQFVFIEMVSVQLVSHCLPNCEKFISYPSKSVVYNAFLRYSASRISLYADGIFAGVPSKKVSLSGKMYES